MTWSSRQHGQAEKTGNQNMGSQGVNLLRLPSPVSGTQGVESTLLTPGDLHLRPGSILSRSKQRCPWCRQLSTQTSDQSSDMLGNLRVTLALTGGGHGAHPSGYSSSSSSGPGVVLTCESLQLLPCRRDTTLLLKLAHHTTGNGLPAGVQFHLCTPIGMPNGYCQN